MYFHCYCHVYIYRVWFHHGLTTNTIIIFTRIYIHMFHNIIFYICSANNTRFLFPQPFWRARRFFLHTRFRSTLKMDLMSEDSKGLYVSLSVAVAFIVVSLSFVVFSLLLKWCSYCCCWLAVIVSDFLFQWFFRFWIFLFWCRV